MLIRKPDDLKWSDVTPESLYLRRREFLASAAVPVLAGAAGLLAGETLEAQGGGQKLTAKKSPLSTTEAQTPFDDITTYNNFYEFGTDKERPVAEREHFKTRALDGHHRRRGRQAGKFAIDDLVKPLPLEERIYRLRCVEAWSMVIPWVGFPLGDVLKKVEPTSKAKYVAFTTLLRSETDARPAPRVLDWPYVEGLRLDEAMHPLDDPRPSGSTARCCRTRTARPAAGRAVEVRLQEHQVDRRDPLRREAAARHVEPLGAAASTASTRT